MCEADERERHAEIGSRDSAGLVESCLGLVRLRSFIVTSAAQPAKLMHPSNKRNLISYASSESRSAWCWGAADQFDIFTNAQYPHDLDR